MRTLRDELERIRAERQWSHGRMAATLGIDRSTYRLFVTGRNRAGRKILGGVARAFPEVNVAYFAAQDVEMAAGAAKTPQDAREATVKGKDTSAGGNGRQSTNSEASNGVRSDLAVHDGRDRLGGHRLGGGGPQRDGAAEEA